MSQNSLNKRHDSLQKSPKTQEKSIFISHWDNSIERQQVRRLKDELCIFQVVSLNSKVIDYLPCEETGVSSLSKEEREDTDRKKREGSRKGKQFVANTEKAKKAGKAARMYKSKAAK